MKQRGRNKQEEQVINHPEARLHSFLAFLAVFQGLRFHGKGDVDLDGRVQRQLGDADGGTGVDAGIAEDLLEEAAGAVGDQMLVGEALCRGDVDHHLEDALDVVDAAGGVRGDGDRVQRAKPGGLLGGLDVVLPADLALIGEFAARGLATGGSSSPISFSRSLGLVI